MKRLPIFLSVALVLCCVAARADERYFQIQVVDEATGRGVPLVELRTVHGVRYFTDSNGVAAFHEPGLMGRRVFFFVESHGYEFPPDGFGIRGAALTAEPGGKATLKIKRVNLAERLYRVTGAGIYRDSVLTGEPVPLREPVLNGRVLGSDSAMNAVYRGKIYWFWGDTSRPEYPLGNFHTPGAVSELPEEGGLHPAEGVELRYFVADDGFAKETANMAGDGPTWIDGLTVLKDEAGRERMFAAYSKIEPPLSVHRRGLIEWSDQEERFEHVAELDLNAPVHPGGQPFQHEENGVRHIYFCTPFPLVRARATAEGLRDLSQYEAYTCLVEGSRLDRPELDRDDDGVLRYAWRRNTPAVGPAEQARLIDRGELQPDEALLQLRDRDTGRPILAHRGSVYWNAYRRRWAMIVCEQGGDSSYLGEIWYAEADTPLGPWAYAVKVVTHDKYSFYNPKQHPMFDQDGGRVIYFEGTYTQSFSDAPFPTPRYDYNQIMYRLDLADPRAMLPVAVYRMKDGSPASLRTRKPPAEPFAWDDVAFFAFDRPREGAVPIYATTAKQGAERLTADPPQSDETAEPLFFGLSSDAAEKPGAAVPLYEYVHQTTGQRRYTTDATWPAEGYRRADSPLCYVWPNPTR